MKRFIVKRFFWMVLLVIAAPALAAQDRPATGDTAEAHELRQRIRQRWHERVREDLRLSNDQAAKLEDTEGRFMQRRREIGERQRVINEALRDQLQPGVAANSDSVRKLMEGRERNRRALVDLEQEENKEIAGYLSPVQQARYQLMREHLRRRIDEIRDRRQAGGRLMGPGGKPPRQRSERPRRNP